MNKELQELFQQDQSDRNELRQDVGERDRGRRQRVAALIDAGALRDPAGYYHAAMVYQHSFRPVVTVGPNQDILAVSAAVESVQCVWRAHELAVQAANLGYAAARWLAADAYDRWLMGQ